MSEQRRAKRNHLDSYTGRGHRVLELLGIVIFGVLAFLIGGEVYRGLVNFGQPWLLLILAILAHLAADLISGFVYFLADNFGPPTPRLSELVS